MWQWHCRNRRGKFFFPSYFSNAIATFHILFFLFFFILRNDMFTQFLQYKTQQILSGRLLLLD